MQAEDNRKSECRSVMERIRIDPIVMHGRGLHYPTRKWADFCDLSRATNDGDVRVLFGSTSMLGTGVNAQKRCVAIHHTDTPWVRREVA